MGEGLGRPGLRGGAFLARTVFFLAGAFFLGAALARLAVVFLRPFTGFFFGFVVVFLVEVAFFLAGLAVFLLLFEEVRRGVFPGFASFFLSLRDTMSLLLDLFQLSKNSENQPLEQKPGKISTSAPPRRQVKK
ncbi:hypothetical protein AMJ85_01595 [candidate division BRC1 bacterium SM23_51]|nr:MAG: hypothetical protein AMJ85_01595 [candidate division BRC1 bacterium SM23_51]